MARVIRKGKVVGLANHTILVSKDGAERPIEDSAAPIKDEAGHLSGVILVFHDASPKRQAAEVHERRRAEEALRQFQTDLERQVEDRAADLAVAKSHLEAVFNSVEEGIVAFDPQGNIIFCNEAEARIAGFSSAREMMRNLSYFAEVFEIADAHGELTPLEQWPVSRVLRGESFNEWECRARRRDTGQM